MNDRYPYPDVTIHATDDKDICVEVTYPDAGTTGNTFINIPNGDNKEIEDAGCVTIGKAKTLRGDFTIITSTPVNLEPRIDKIRETIKVAGEVVADYDKLKSEDTGPQIVVCVKFEK